MTRHEIKEVTTLWKMHFDQQSLYKAVMKTEIPGGLRSLCGKGYMIASVCMKEIALMYQHVSRDDEFGRVMPQDSVDPDLPDDCSGETVAGYLRKKQADLIRRYLGIREHFSRDEEYLKLLADHIFLLRQLGKKLRESCKAERKTSGYVSSC